MFTNAELVTGVVSSILRDSNLKKADALCVEEALALSLQGAASVCPSAFSYPLCTYTKSLARRASSAESSAKAAKAYKAKVASLTSEKAELRDRIQSLIEDVVKHKSDLKHTSTAKARAEDREKKAIEGLRVVKDELRVVKEEFRAAREELCTKAATLDRGS